MAGEKKCTTPNRPLQYENLMPRLTLIKLIAAVVMAAFGIIVSLNWYHIAEGEPGWIGWVVIILSPVLYPRDGLDAAPEIHSREVKPGIRRGRRSATRKGFALSNLQA